MANPHGGSDQHPVFDPRPLLRNEVLIEDRLWRIPPEPGALLFEDADGHIGNRNIKDAPSPVRRRARYLWKPKAQAHGN